MVDLKNVCNMRHRPGKPYNVYSVAIKNPILKLKLQSFVGHQILNTNI